MQDPAITEIAELVQARNAIDHRIAAIIERPMTSGHLGEWLAGRVFDIALEGNAARAALDGRFRSGQLAGKAVNVKWYLKREGLLDLTPSTALDYYLVLAGPAGPAVSSRGGIRPWCIASVHLFDAQHLVHDLISRGVKIGVASSVRAAHWTEAEIYPRRNNRLLPVGPEQEEGLRLFAPTGDRQG